MHKPRFNYFKAPDNDDYGGCHIIFYSEWGAHDNKDVVFCVHGLSRNCRDFDYLAQSLADTHRVICIDIAGRGKSERLSRKADYNYDTYVVDVLNIVKHLGLEKISWVGTSMGGIIGMMIAARNPDLIEKMVLNDIGCMIKGKAIDHILQYVGDKREFDSEIDAQIALKERMISFGIKKMEHWQHIFKHSIIRKLNGKFIYAYDPAIIEYPKTIWKFQWFFAKFIPWKKSVSKDVKLFDIWEKVSCPVLLLRGEESDILTRDIASDMLQSKSDIGLIEFESVGHAPMLMDEIQIAPVKEFLEGYP